MTIEQLLLLTAQIDCAVALIWLIERMFPPAR